MVPPPPDFRRVTPLFHAWPAGEPIVRVFNHDHLPNAFNPGKGGGVRGRFHFFEDSAGAVVPALYGSDQEDGAIAETVFHDVPVRGDHRVVLESRLAPLSIVTLFPARDLRLVELLGFGLQRLEVRAEELTSTEASEYVSTLRWAAAIHAAFGDVDGLVWMSRQFNAARALVLFGDRVKSVELEIELVAPPIPLAFGPGRIRLDDAANRAGIAII
jgi:hypothetical protein